jgi:hypothetical protein
MAYIVLKPLHFPETELTTKILALKDDPDLKQDDLGDKKAFILNRALKSDALAGASPATQVLALSETDKKPTRLIQRIRPPTFPRRPGLSAGSSSIMTASGTPTKTSPLPSQKRRPSGRISPTFISAAACLAGALRRKR